MSETTITPPAATGPKLIIGIPKEVHAGERRVAATPDTARKLQKLGFVVTVEHGAGESADFPDARYIEADCTIAADARELWANANIILKVRAPEDNHSIGGNEAHLLTEDKTLISFLAPAQNPELVSRLVATKATVIA